MVNEGAWRCMRVTVRGKCEGGRFTLSAFCAHAWIMQTLVTFLDLENDMARYGIDNEVDRGHMRLCAAKALLRCVGGAEEGVRDRGHAYVNRDC